MSPFPGCWGPVVGPSQRDPSCDGAVLLFEGPSFPEGLTPCSFSGTILPPHTRSLAFPIPFSFRFQSSCVQPVVPSSSEPHLRLLLQLCRAASSTREKRPLVLLLSDFTSPNSVSSNPHELPLSFTSATPLAQDKPHLLFFKCVCPSRSVLSL